LTEQGLKDKLSLRRAAEKVGHLPERNRWLPDVARRECSRGRPRKRFKMQSLQVSVSKRHEVTLQQLRSERRAEMNRLDRLKANLQAKIELSGQGKRSDFIQAA